MSKYGADGVRFGLMRIAPTGQDIRFDEKQIEEGRNFATKLWNAARFRQMHGPSDPAPELAKHAVSIYAQEVLARLDETIVAIDGAYREYRFNEVAQRLYDFFWSDYCDWYVEAAKTDIFAEDAAKRDAALAVMDFVLSAVLRLLHPFMPHTTEELWHVLALGSETIQFSPVPKPTGIRSAERARVAAVYQTVQAGRNLRAESRVASNKKSQFILKTSAEWVTQELPTLSRLMNAERVHLDADYAAPSGRPVAATALGELFLEVASADRAAERERLEKEIAKLEGELRTVNAKLGNPSFLDKAPAAVVEEHRRRKADFDARRVQLIRAREAL
jgi:valyl-tRNA synthetase